MVEAKRNSWLEAYRILAMALIVVNHFSTSGGLSFDLPDAPFFNAYFAKVLACGGKLGVDMFVLISSYFLSASVVRVSSLLLTWLKTVFWGLLIFAAMSASGLPVNGKLADALIPVMRYNYWFVSCYIVLAILSPFLATMLRGLGERRHRCLLIILLAFFSIFPTFLHLKAPLMRCFHTPIAWFVVMFVLGAYLRCHVRFDRISVSRTVGVLLGSISVVLLWVLACEAVGRWGHHEWRWRSFRDMYSIFMVLVSTSLFVLFAKMRPCWNVWVNRLAACTFGVYLIHTNRNLSPVIWDRMLGVKSTVGYVWFPVFAIVSSLAVYLACTALELVRQALMRPVERWLRNRLADVDRTARLLVE